MRGLWKTVNGVVDSGATWIARTIYDVAVRPILILLANGLKRVPVVGRALVVCVDRWLAWSSEEWTEEGMPDREVTAK